MYQTWNYLWVIGSKIRRWNGVGFYGGIGDGEEDDKNEISSSLRASLLI